MALKEYKANLHGFETTMLLDEAEAKRLGAKPLGKVATSSNKVATSANKARGKTAPAHPEPAQPDAAEGD